MHAGLMGSPRFQLQFQPAYGLARRVPAPPHDTPARAGVLPACRHRLHGPLTPLLHPRKRRIDHAGKPAGRAVHDGPVCLARPPRRETRLRRDQRLLAQGDDKAARCILIQPVGQPWAVRWRESRGNQSSTLGPPLRPGWAGRPGGLSMITNLLSRYRTVKGGGPEGCARTVRRGGDFALIPLPWDAA